MIKDNAIKIAEAELENSKDKYNPIDCAILENETIEKDWGWIFFYQSKVYIESGDFRDMLGGNAPIFIDKKTGKLSYAGTAFGIDHYIKEYEALL